MCFFSLLLNENYEGYFRILLGLLTFVNKGNKDVFYKDDDHSSTKGADMINELIMKKIEKIEANSN